MEHKQDDDMKLRKYLMRSKTDCLYCLFNEHGAYDDQYTSDCHYLDKMIRRLEMKNCDYYINADKYLRKNKEAILKNKVLYE